MSTPPQPLSMFDRVILPKLLLETHEHEYAERQRERAERANRERMYLQASHMHFRQSLMLSMLTNKGEVPRIHDDSSHCLDIDQVGTDFDQTSYQNALEQFEYAQREIVEDATRQHDVVLHNNVTYHCNLRHARRQFFVRILAEIIGTMILVFVHGTMKIYLNERYRWVNSTGHALFDGFVLTFLINSLGGISGAHFNPCVTLAFVLIGDFPAMWIIPYYLAQFCGALLAAGFIRAYFTGDAYLATSAVRPTWTEAGGFGWEIMLTFLLLLVILHTASKGHVFGPHSAISVGFVIAVVVALGAETSSASMNPFRTLGPAAVNGGERTSSLWCFVAGPYVGTILAVLAVFALYAAQRRQDQRKAAVGFGKEIK